MDPKDILILVQISLDGNQWCALVGENLQEGTAGFGDTIADALHQLAFRMEHHNPETTPPAKVTVDDELLEKVTRFLALKPIVKEYDFLKELIKTTVEGEPRIELGGFDITGKYITRKAYECTVKECTYWKMDISPNPGRLALVKQ